LELHAKHTVPLAVAPLAGNAVESQPVDCVPHRLIPGADVANSVPPAPLNRTQVPVLELKID